VLSLLPSLAYAQAPRPLPLDLAYSRREIERHLRPTLSPDGRYLAYDVKTPPVKTPQVAEETEQRFLPSGLPSEYVGLNLWISDTRSGQSKAICDATVTCWRGSFSPDSQKLAYFSDEGGTLGAWIYDIASGTKKRAASTPIKVKLWPGDEAAWSPDGKTLYIQLPPPGPIDQNPKNSTPATKPLAANASVTVYRTRAASAATGAEVPSDTSTMDAFFLKENNASFAAVDLATGAVRTIVPYDAAQRPNNMRLSPDGKWISYLTVFHAKSATSFEAAEDLVVLPASGGKPVAIFRDIKMPENDYFGSTYRWTPDSKRIVFTKNADLWIADIAPAGASQPRQLAKSLGKLTETPFLLTADGKSIVVGIEREGEKEYYVVPPKALAVVPLDGSAPRVLDVSGAPIAGSDSAVWQPDAGTLYVIRDSATAAEREVVAVNTTSGAVSPVWSGHARLNVVGAIPNSNTAVARFEGTTVAPDFYILDRKMQRVKRLTTAEPRLEGIDIGPMESFESVIPQYDGKLKTVRTHIFLPSNWKKGDRLPTIVYFYSGLPFALYAQDFGGGSPNSIPVQIFATRGYGVLFCDVPLSPEGTTGGNPMQEMTEAVLAQVYRSADLGYTDIQRVAIMGQSYGGYSTAAVITQTNLFRAAMALDGVYDLGGNYGWMTPDGGTFTVGWSETGQGRMGQSPWVDLKRYIANSPYYQADKIHTPLLLIHGEKDSACPVIEARKMFSALKRLDRDAELAIYAGEGHVPGVWALANATDATERMLDFLARHMK